MPIETLTHDQASELYGRLSREAAARNSRARRLRIVGKSGAGVALVAVLALGAGLTLHWSSSSHGGYSFTPTLHTKEGGRAIQGLAYHEWRPRIDDFGAIGNGKTEALSVDEARATAVFAAGIPTSDLVPESSIRKIWFFRDDKDDPDHQPNYGAVEYDHLEVLYYQEESEESPTLNGPSVYRAMAAQGADFGAHVVTVQGVPAFMGPARIGADNLKRPGLVMFMKGRVQISVRGYYSEDDLIAIANSIEWAGR